MNTSGSVPTAAALAPPGLKGVPVAETTIGSVRGDEGFFHYREHDAVDLARHNSLEAVWHLLVHGSLPSEAQEQEFRSKVASMRVLDEATTDAVSRLARSIEAPHLVLLASLGLLSPHGVPTLDQTREELCEAALRLAAATPTVLAVAAAARVGRPLPQANPDSPHAADWLAMAAGSPGPTPAAAARAVESYLTVTMDHGFNASTFATRVVTSTGADVAASLAAGVGALSGPLHGGAPARALAMIEEIDDPANTEAWVRDRLDRGQKIMGFGHAVYRVGDPRSALMAEVAEALVVDGSTANKELVARASEIEGRILAELRRHRPGAVIVTNVEFYAGVVLYLVGLPPEAFTPSFTVSRVIGWSAHLLEQAGDNKIIRPAARYVGPEPRRAVAQAN